jgi:alcohol dehydrogenase
MREKAMSWSFVHSTREMVVGAGCVARAAETAGKEGRRRPALVLDPWFAGNPAALALAAGLRAACGAEPAVHAVPPGEPDLDAVEGVRAALAGVDPDVIVVLGGGSAMDAAKVGRMLLSNPGDPAAIAGPAGVKMNPHPSLFVAVPTTAGTGSEVSESAVISVPGESYKMIFRSPEMTPQLALLDPALAASAPASVTAASGLDAVTHAVEAFWSRAANPVTDTLAREAMRLLAAGLPLAYAHPADPAAREQCLLGSALAAMAFNSAHLGLAHAVSGALGALHHVPHGLGNALALPHVAAFNAEATPEKAAEVGRIFGADTAAEALFRLRHALGLDVSLDTLVPPAALDGVAAGAMRSGQLQVNPRPTNQADIRALLERMRRPWLPAP